MKRIFNVLALSALALLSVKGIRALLHTPEITDQVERVDYALDEGLILAHLSESIQFQTISHQGSLDLNADDFDNLQSQAKAAQPRKTFQIKRDSSDQRSHVGFGLRLQVLLY